MLWKPTGVPITIVPSILLIFLTLFLPHSLNAQFSKGHYGLTVSGYTDLRDGPPYHRPRLRTSGDFGYQYFINKRMMLGLGSNYKREMRFINPFANRNSIVYQHRFTLPLQFRHYLREKGWRPFFAFQTDITFISTELQYTTDSRGLPRYFFEFPITTTVSGSLSFGIDIPFSPLGTYLEVRSDVDLFYSRQVQEFTQEDRQFFQLDARLRNFFDPKNHRRSLQAESLLLRQGNWSVQGGIRFISQHKGANYYHLTFDPKIEYFPTKNWSIFTDFYHLISNTKRSSFFPRVRTHPHILNLRVGTGYNLSLAPQFYLRPLIALRINTFTGYNPLIEYHPAIEFQYFLGPFCFVQGNQYTIYQNLQKSRATSLQAFNFYLGLEYAFAPNLIFKARANYRWWNQPFAHREYLDNDGGSFSRLNFGFYFLLYQTS